MWLHHRWVRWPLLAILLLSPPAPAQQLPGTQSLTRQGDLAEQMVEGIRGFLLRETEASIDRRQARWNRDFSSREAYEKSVAANRERFARLIGLIDPRTPDTTPGLEVEVGADPVVASGPGYRVYAVRWPVLEGVEGEGLLLEPTAAPLARVVALPDADWTPEMLAGLVPGVPPEAQFARRLAENGCLVLVPVLIDRADTWSGNPEFSILTNEPHREFIYRMAYEVGRHIIGYEVQKVLAAVDGFAHARPQRPIGVVGYGEGGLLAFYSAARDTRINAALVSGYFASRQEIWKEPIYRNVWGLLTEFGDAGLASLVAPRALVVEASRAPEIPGPPPADGRRNSAAPGRLTTPRPEAVQREFERAKPFFAKLDAGEKLSLVVNGQGNPGSEPALREFLRSLGATSGLRPSGPAPLDRRRNFDPSSRLHRQLTQLIDFTQEAVRDSDYVRQKFWAKADASSVDNWNKSKQFYRDYFWEEVIGRFPDPSEPMVARTRLIYDEVNWTGYEVLLPVWPDVDAYGILLLPKDLKPGERRPVIVCQHGLEGRPQDLVKPSTPSALRAYHQVAAVLADHGFVVFCPQNPYLGGEKFRSLLRIAHPIKRSLYSVILGQHQRILEWLASQPFVDPKRIAFYGLSYGGKTAVRVPPLLEGYSLSICSGDFNQWVWKVSRYDSPLSYIYSPEYDMLEFDFGNTFNYGDLGNLMAPRPFMVERGHTDGVGTDEWVAYEYARVRRHYDLLGIPERTRIEFFSGPHTIHGVGTFEFLYRFLNLPDR